MLPIREQLNNNLIVLQLNQNKAVELLSNLMTLHDQLTKKLNAQPDSQYADKFEKYTHNIESLTQTIQQNIYLIDKHTKDLQTFNEQQQEKSEQDQQLEILQFQQIMRLKQLNQYILKKIRAGGVEYMEMRTLMKYCGRIKDVKFLGK